MRNGPDTRAGNRSASRHAVGDAGASVRRELGRSRRSAVILDAEFGARSGLKGLGVLAAVAAVALSLFEVSVGATGHGTLRGVGDLAPIVAPRDGTLDWDERDPTTLTFSANEVIGTIRSLDIALSRPGPDLATSLEDLRKRERTILSRLEELAERHAMAQDRSSAVRRAVDDEARTVGARMDRLVPQVEDAKRELAEARAALSKGIVRRAAVDERQRDLRSLELTRDELESRERSLATRLAELEVEDSDRQQRYQAGNASLGDQLGDVRRLMRSDEAASAVPVRAGKDGRYLQRPIPTGSYVAVGQILFDPVPGKNGFMVDVDVPNAMIADIRVGQPVRLALDAFPYHRYGFLDATVVIVREGMSSVDRSELPDSYRVLVRPEPMSRDDPWAERTLLPGMTATAHISVDRIPLWRVVTAPLIRAVSRFSLGEAGATVARAVEGSDA